MSGNPEVVKVLQSISTQRLARAPMSFTLGMLPHAALTFSMAGEDMAMRKLLKRHVVAGKGTYVDIGCGAPDSISNTCLFYCMGWRGLRPDIGGTTTDKGIAHIARHGIAHLNRRMLHEIGRRRFQRSAFAAFQA